MPLKLFPRPALISILRKKQGNKSLREFAPSIGISAAYLSDVYSGRRQLGPAILSFLKMKKAPAIQLYERVGK